MLCGCDRSTPTPSPLPVATSPAPPGEGILRLTKKSGVPEAVKDLIPGLPVLHLQVEYSGPKRWLEIDTVGWAGGKSLSGGDNISEIELPLSGSIVIGFGEGTLLESTPDGT